MNHKCILYIVIIQLFLPDSVVFGKQMNNKVGYVFVGLTESYRLGGIRFGRNNWEFGIFPGGIGIGSLYRNDKHPFYGVIAPVLGYFPGATPVGLNGSVGGEFAIFKILDLRFELSTSYFANGIFSPFVIFGLGAHI